MPRHSWKRFTVEECDPLRIRDLVTAGVFLKQNAPSGTLSWSEGQSALGYKLFQFPDRVYFLLLPEGKTELPRPSQWVEITKTACNYGGWRLWFRCPGAFGQLCGRRASVLYRPYDNMPFLCRNCHGLTYQSSQRHDKRLDRAAQNPSYLVELLNSRKLGQRLLGLRAANKLAGTLANSSRIR